MGPENRRQFLRQAAVFSLSMGLEPLLPLVPTHPRLRAGDMVLQGEKRAITFLRQAMTPGELVLAQDYAAIQGLVERIQAPESEVVATEQSISALIAKRSLYNPNVITVTDVLGTKTTGKGDGPANSLHIRITTVQTGEGPNGGKTIAFLEGQTNTGIELTIPADLEQGEVVNGALRANAFTLNGDAWGAKVSLLCLPQMAAVASNRPEILETQSGPLKKKSIDRAGKVTKLTLGAEWLVNTSGQGMIDPSPTTTNVGRLHVDKYSR